MPHTTETGLLVPCLRCGAKAYEKCRNYLGKNKQTCPQRGRPVEACKVVERPVQRDLFGG